MVSIKPNSPQIYPQNTLYYILKVHRDPIGVACQVSGTDKERNNNKGWYFIPSEKDMNTTPHGSALEHLYRRGQQILLLNPSVKYGRIR